MGEYVRTEHNYTRKVGSSNIQKEATVEKKTPGTKQSNSSKQVCLKILFSLFFFLAAVLVPGSEIDFFFSAPTRPTHP
jgi:hypothetical protein